MMMNLRLSLLLGLMLLLVKSRADRSASEALACSYPGSDPAKRGEAVCIVNSCDLAIKAHIKHELSAAFSYLYMAAYFDQVAVSRPGLAKVMYESASEERAHAISMLEYLDRRGVVYEVEGDYSFQLQAGLTDWVSAWMEANQHPLDSSRLYQWGWTTYGAAAWKTASQLKGLTEAQYLDGWDSYGREAWIQALEQYKAQENFPQEPIPQEKLTALALSSWEEAWKNAGFQAPGEFPFYKGPTGEYSYQEALKIALEMEMEVTNKITEVISSCSDDYDGADFFTQPILAEQFDGQRKLTGAINTLSDMIGGQVDQSAFAEYVFDQRVLKNGL